MRRYPSDTTVGSGLNAATIWCPSPSRMASTTSCATSASASETSSTRLQRLTFPAPKFWPTKVVHAWLNEFSRLYTTYSSEMTAELAAMTSVPRLLMHAWMTMLASENTALCSPAGRPILTTRASTARSMPSSRGFSLIGASMRVRRTNRMSALTV